LVIGWVAVAVCLNSVLGVAYRRVFHIRLPLRELASSDRAAFEGYYGRTEVVDGSTDSAASPVHFDQPKVRTSGWDEAPAFRSSSWRDEYAGDVERLSLGYEPYVTVRTQPLATPYVNVSGGVRQSWTPPTDGRRQRIVWLFGGSATFGIGQRDDHTIASELARIGHARGVSIKVVNFGVPTFTNFQEVLRFERELHHRPRPDLAIFYDGANDLGIQSAYPYPQPTRPPMDVEFHDSTPESDSTYALWARTSLVTILWRQLTGSLSTPAGASVAEGAARTPPDPTDVAKYTASVYARGVRIARELGAEFRVETRFFWQPAAWYRSSPAWPRVRSSLPGEVVDLSAVFDARTEPVYIDDVHTNERGARIVAERMWREVGPALTDRLAR
jgi:hypothetical protein